MPNNFSVFGRYLFLGQGSPGLLLGHGRDPQSLPFRTAITPLGL